MSLSPSFDGKTFDAKQDAPRLRLQLALVYDLMKDGQWRTPERIVDAVPRLWTSGTASITARLRDLRKPKFGAYKVECRRVRQGAGAFEYRLSLPDTIDRLPGMTS